MAGGYLGKISAVVAINASSVAPTLNSAGKTVNDWARKTQSTISSAMNNAGRSISGIYTPLQKLETALKQANRLPLQLRVQNPQQILQVAKAAEQIAKPLGQAQQGFTRLSQSVQAELQPVLQAAQKQSTQLFEALSNGAKVSETDIQNTAARVERLISAFSRARQASQLIRGLGNGQELQFQNPEFVEQARRSAQLQQQASSLTASQLSGSSIVNLIGQQRAAADEAERLRAALDKVRTTRNGDAAAAQAAYSNQLAQLAGINDRIERQIALIQRAAAAEQSAASARSAAQQQVTTQRNSLASASAALTGGITPQVQDVNEVFSNLTSRAQQARAAVANAFRTPEAADLRNRLAQIAAEVGNIQDEYRTLSAQDPQRREILRWQDLEERVQAVNFRLGAVTSLANQAREALGGVADEFTEAQLQAQRLAAANERLVVDQQESQVLSNEGASSRRATPVPRSVFEEGFARQIRNELGPAITDQQRQFDVLRGSIVSVKGQLDTLPAGVRSQFIPAIQQAEAEFQRLRALGPDATAEAIENAANEVDRLGQQLRRVSQVQSLPNFADSLNETSLRGAIGSLNAFQQILSRIGATAGSELGQAFDRMRAIIQRATRDGTVGTQAFQQELRRAAREAANLAAQTGRISASRAFREIQRGGDIARGGFDRLSLATQQAAFALDDFFSVQGDFSQRIRAVQNNITQLAFILGGTPALFVAIGTAIAAQAAVGLVRWYNEGRTAEDQTRALNDALASQKSLAEELARAFESLGDSIADRAFSRSAQEARAFLRELEAIERQQRELRESRAVDANPDIGVVRADQNRIQRELDQERDAGRRIVLQRQLEESRQAEQRVRSSILSAPAAGGNEVRQALQGVLEQFAGASANARRAGGGPLFTESDAALAALDQNISQVLRRTDFGGTLEAIESQIAAIESVAGNLSPVVEGGISGVGISRQASDAVVLLERLAATLRLQRVDKELDDAARKIFESSNSVSRGIAAAQDAIVQPLASGLPGAAAVEDQLNALGERLRSALQSLADSRGLAPGERRAQQQAAEENIRNIQREFEARNDVISSVESFAQALDRASGQLADITLRDAESRAQQARRNANELLARAFSPDALGVRDDDRVQQARQADRVARRAEDDFAAAQERNRRFAAQRDSAIQDFSRQAAAGTLGRDLQASISRLTQARRDSSNATLPAGEREAATRLVQTLERQLSEAFERTPAARRLAQQANTADVANQINAQLDRDREQFNQSVSRGRDFLVSPQQRQSQELQRQLDDATNAALQGLLKPLEGGIFPQRAQAELDAINAVVDDGFITLAEIGDLFQKFPSIRDELRGPVEQAIAQLEGVRGNIEDSGIAAQLAENRANAALQGPSRAALSASDITSTEGQRELNRLLRGDDPARDVNLEEARKQNTKLDQVNEHLDKLRQIFAGVAD